MITSRFSLRRTIATLEVALLLYAGAPAFAQDEPAAIDNLFAALPAYTFDSGEDAVAALREAVYDSYNDPASQNDLANRFVDLVNSPDATPEAKQFACRMLALCAGADQIPAIAEWLTDPALSDGARYALEQIDSILVYPVFVDALAQAEEKVAIGILNGLGNQGDSNVMQLMLLQPALISVVSKSRSDAIEEAIRAAITRLSLPRDLDWGVEPQGVSLADSVAMLLSPTAQGDLLRQAAATGLPVVEEAALARLGPDFESIRQPVLETLVEVGTRRSVRPLIELAAVSRAKERREIQDALERMRGDGIDNVLLRLAKSPDGEIAAQAMLALGSRQTEAAMPTLLEAAVAQDSTRADAAWDALAMLASADEMEALVERAAAAGDEYTRPAADALTQTLLRCLDREACADTLANAVADLGDQPNGATLLDVFARVPTSRGLVVLRTASASDDATVRLAAIRAMANWPDATPREDLLRLAGAPTSVEERDAALAGYARMVIEDASLAEEDASLAEDAAILRLAEVLFMTDSPDIGRTVMRAYEGMHSVAARDRAATYIGHPVFGDAAAEAVEALASVDYRATATHNEAAAGMAFDGDVESRWTSDTRQTAGMAFTIDLGKVNTVRGVDVNAASSRDDYPARFRVSTSTNADGPFETGDEESPRRALSRFRFDARECQYIRLEIVEPNPDADWSIHDVHLLTGEPQ